MSDQINEQKIKQLLMLDEFRNIGIELAAQFLGWSVVECVEFCIVEFHKQTYESETEKSILFDFDWCKFSFEIESCFDCKGRFQYRVVHITQYKERHLVNFYYKSDFKNPIIVGAMLVLFKKLRTHIEYYAEKTN